MLEDGTYIGVVDRFEGDQAVVVLQEDDADVADVTLARTALPEEGLHEDAVFRVDLEDGDVVGVTYEPQETVARKEEAQSRFDRLSKRPPRDEDEEEGNR
jgi:hypothetical protein